MTINIFAHGHWDYYDSYGLIAAQLARHFTALGEDINAYKRSGATFRNLPEDIDQIVKQRHYPVNGGIFLGYPTVFHEHGVAASQHPRIALTMFESTRIPDKWASILNGFDAVVTPCQFCADSFRDCGVIAPIVVTPLGISEVYQYAEREPDRPLTFIAFADRGDRKGGMLAKDAFIRTFGDDTDYHLILKQRKTHLPSECLNPNITWIQQDMTEQELYQLYLKADVMISANKGEGFGLLPREFAATGGISLATDWAGTADDLDEWGWPLRYSLAKSAWGESTFFGGQDLGFSAQPDEDDLVDAMRAIAANPDEYKERAKARAQRVSELYTWRGFAEKVLNLYHTVREPFPEAMA